MRGLASLLFLAALTVAGQQEPAAPPTFSAGTKLVQVDVVARNKDGPVAGLTKGDFTVLDNGKPQRISFFSVKSRTASASGSASAPTASPLPVGAVSNRLERAGELSANATVLLIDQINTPPAAQAYAIPRVVKFLQMHRIGDRIGVYTLSLDGLEVVQEITDDAELLSRAARSLKARSQIRRSHDTTGMTAHAATDYEELEAMEGAAGFRDVLKDVARHLAKVPGRKSLIWVTNSFPLFVPPPPQPPIRDFRKEMEDGARALNDANVALYAVDARGLQGALDGMTAIQNAELRGPQTPGQLRQQMKRGQPASPDGLLTEQFLAGLTGGLVIYNQSNAIEESIRTLADDGEITYTLGFYPAQEAQDGTLHDLKVTVDHPGVSLRYRKNYSVSKTATTERASLEDLLRDSLNATQLELIAEPMPDPARPGSWNVRATVDLHDVQLERQGNVWVGGVDISFRMEGSRTFDTITRTVAIPDRQLAAYQSKGIVVTHAVQLDGGQPRMLRIVAQDRATGAAGSVRVLLGRK